MGLLPPQLFPVSVWHPCLCLPAVSVCGCSSSLMGSPRSCLHMQAESPTCSCGSLQQQRVPGTKETGGMGAREPHSAVCLHHISCDLSKSFALCVNEEVKNNIVRVQIK